MLDVPLGSVRSLPPFLHHLRTSRVRLLPHFHLPCQPLSLLSYIPSLAAAEPSEERRWSSRAPSPPSGHLSAPSSSLPIHHHPASICPKLTCKLTRHKGQLRSSPVRWHVKGLELPVICPIQRGGTGLGKLGNQNVLATEQTAALLEWPAASMGHACNASSWAGGSSSQGCPTKPFLACPCCCSLGTAC